MISFFLTLTFFGVLLQKVSSTGAIYNSKNRTRSTLDLISLTRSPRNKAGEFDPIFDCAWRVYALSYATQIQPWLTTSQLSGINDALSITSLNCNTSEADKILAEHKPILKSSTSVTLSLSSISIYVDYLNGNDENSGTIDQPLKTIFASVLLARSQRGQSGSTIPISIILRSGTHVLNNTINLTPNDSYTTFVAFPGESPIVTGAQPLPKLVWTPFNVTNSSKSFWGPVLNNTNAVYGECPSSSVPDKGVMNSWQDCQSSCQADKTCTAWTYHTPLCTGCTGFVGHCCWHLDDEFPAVNQIGVISQQLIGAINKNIWVADLNSLPSGSQTSMTALHINGHRATLARFPNANPEYDIFPKGYIMTATWLPPIPGPVWNETYTVDLRPLGLADMGSGIYINYTVGIGGNAARYDPPRSFWSSRDFGPQRYQPTATCDRWDEMHLRSPSGLDTSSSLVNAPYMNISQLVVRTWREAHWFSWMFTVGEQNGSKFIFNGGGHQGGEGCDNAAEYFVQGIIEELDAVNEYFYDNAAGKLYFFPNITDQNPDGSPNVQQAEVPTLAVFFNLFGSEEFPVTNITFNGLTFTGGRPTFLDPHGQPSGGDWALERLGVILVEGSTNVEISDCLFTRIDGNAVFLGGYNRGLLILRNEFSLLGANAICSWGRSDFYDGTGGQQPRRGLIYGNIAHDIGLEQKQSSFYFTAQSCENTITANIVYNVPRAAINFEDGFGGATLVQDNLLFNTCRESSDHSSINSWSRMPYVTMVRDGVTPSAIPAYSNFSHNFIVNNYAADGGGVDADDGSSWFIMNDNSFLFGGHKSDFDGHSKHSIENLHLYASVYGDRCIAILAQILPLPGFADSYVNNTCVLVPNAECIDFGQSKNNFPSVEEFKQRIVFGNNTIYNTLGTACAANGGVWNSFKEFQDGGYETGDPSTVISTLPSAATMIQWMKQKLDNPEVRIEKAIKRFC